jgi:hypothetical protein
MCASRQEFFETRPPANFSECARDLSNRPANRRKWICAIRSAILRKSRALAVAIKQRVRGFNRRWFFLKQGGLAIAELDRDTEADAKESGGTDWKTCCEAPHPVHRYFAACECAEVIPIGQRCAKIGARNFADSANFALEICHDAPACAEGAGAGEDDDAAVITGTVVVCWRFRIGIAAPRRLDRFADRGSDCFRVHRRDEEHNGVGSDRDIDSGDKIADEVKRRAICRGSTTPSFIGISFA